MADSTRCRGEVSRAHLDEGERVISDLDGREVAVSNVEGEYQAVGNYCPHMSDPCAEGLLAGFFEVNEDGNLTYSRETGVISCPWHGWEFDVETGEQLSESKKRLLTYDVIVRDGDVCVGL